MPDPRKVRWSQLKVGIVALTAFIIIFTLVFLLTSSKGIFRHYATLYTYMEDASGIQDGAIVRLNGIGIGYLDNLTLTNSSNPKHTVKFIMKVRERYLKDIPTDSIAGISAANLLGDKFINITKGTSKQTVQEDAVLPSAQPQDIPELMAESGRVLQTLQTIVNRADAMLAGVEAGRGNLGKLIKDEDLYDRLTAIEGEGQQLLHDIRKGNGTIGKLIYDDTLYNQMVAPLRRIDAMLADLQAGQGTAGKLLRDPALFDTAEQSLAEIRSLIAGVNAGHGTAGKLIKDEELYNRLDRLVAQFNTTVDKINSGQGTIGQLVVNPQLYESLTGATREMQTLAKDIRANPKKFLTLRLKLF